MTPRTAHPLRLVAIVALVAILGAVGVTAAGAAPVRSTTAAVATSSRADRPAAPRAMWVWDTSDPESVVALATTRGIGQLYAAVPPNVGTSPQLAQLRRLVELADEAGLRVDALGGDPGWVDNPTWVVNSWLKPALATGLFTGVHVDIEPYTTAAWTTNRKAVVKRYLSTLDTLRTAAGTAPIEADIPFWYDEIAANGSTLDRETIRRTTAVTVMAYRNLADGVDGSIALSANEIQAGADLGRQVRIGQETTFLGTDPTEVKQTFFGQGLTQMESQLSRITAAYAGSPSFAGLAVHDAAGYAAVTD
ncbi:hypothetical protein [Phycicoccus sp. Soil748]|uniref:hypothetical protein n=1 Tax=Phycicoccus sp. Soil748 TaxID=1736397 RepID=UPI000702EA76|nr:hypothetical protein [Phycicoccus sp. Soil748]KRE54895.1 hypothetical protein ASG70_05395 [Phycicoccus sp. Soil748]